eukprot:596580-Heterocapsa_arctica.AAC.1
MSLRFPVPRSTGTTRAQMNRSIAYSSTVNRSGRKRCSRPNKFRCTKEPTRQDKTGNICH